MKISTWITLERPSMTEHMNGFTGWLVATSKECQFLANLFPLSDLLLLERRKIALGNTGPVMTGSSIFIFSSFLITTKNQICCSLNSTCSSLSHSARVKNFFIPYQIVPASKGKPSSEIHCIIGKLLYVSLVQSGHMTQNAQIWSGDQDISVTVGMFDWN